jgi:hypothetical protein
MSMPALSEGTKGALASNFKGGDGGGPVQRCVVAKHRHRRENHAVARPVVPVQRGELPSHSLRGERRGGCNSARLNLDDTSARPYGHTSTGQQADID